MKCTVYWGNSGFVVVPECVVASREAERRHGPLLDCARIETDGLDTAFAEAIGAAIDQRTYACVGTDLALHASYTPRQPLPLPFGFRWERYGDAREAPPMLLTCGWYPPALVAELMPTGERGGWIAITHCHKAWTFRGLRVAQTHMAAMHYIVAWASINAPRLRNEIMRMPAIASRPRHTVPKQRQPEAEPTAMRHVPVATGGSPGAAYTSPAP